MPDRRWLILEIEAPLIAFGGVAIDHVGVTRDFPAASMLTGLFANALGWQRTDCDRHQALQDRLIFAARLDRESPTGLLTDMQNAQLDKKDRGWTTWGIVEGRDGASYGAPHRRRRDYHMDARVVMAVTLAPPAGDHGEGATPDLDTLATALHRPARPLFIGRKTCLPSRPLLPARREDWFVEAPDAYEALARVPWPASPAIRVSSKRTAAASETPAPLRAFWPLGEGPDDGAAVHHIHDLPDLRNWRSGLHGGARPVVEGVVMAGGPAV
ncbi:CRISPR-associated protein, Cas5e family [Rhizobium sp. RU20A]|uniref:type I-E CRISPR-associated protein Cas5/CasD n=1 Tax=Rhizobium sp. RU20A TaxID=1907412 RepID=UPI0009568E08|nr:type I-E CRISPR-associated protein Cas5/CasD [Rhizobium sp. RU20A]SIR19070.1 CRISPR-associated protein, Cas5e family [Rhizobium sp. RU20A]